MKKKATRRTTVTQGVVPQVKPIPSKSYSLWWYIIPPIILVGLTALFYGPSLHYEFQFDSIANITKHFSIRHNGFHDLFLKGTRWISYWLNSVYYSIGQFDPFSYRLGNVIIHTLNGLLVFFILFLGLKNLRRTTFFSTNAFPVAFLSALLFLLHPVQTQTVSYVIQGQLEGLAALFILSMLLCFYLRSRARNRVLRYFLTALLFGLALLSCGTKEISIISPALLVLLDWFFIAQGEWKSLKSRLLLHATVALFIFGIYLYMLKPKFFTDILGLKKIANNNIGNVITHSPKEKITPWMFFRSQFKVILHYLWMFIWPFGISVEYDWMLSRGILYPDALFPLFVLIGLAAGVLRVLRKNMAHLVGFGALWFFVCLAPRSSIIPSPELLVDYKTYLASLGWLFLIASAVIWGAAFALAKIKALPKLLQPQAYGLPAVAVTLAIILGSLTTQRNTVWRSGLDFWGNIIKNAPGKARAYNNYGVELSQIKKDYEGSIPHFKKAIAMDKNYPDPLNNLSVAYSHLGKLDEAIKTLQQSLRINPYYPEGYNNLASFYIQKEDLDRAQRSLEIALKLRPHYGKAYFNMGRIYLQKKEKEKAWECFKNSCTRADFDIKFGFLLYGQTSMELQKYEDAIYAYEGIRRLEPTNLQNLFNLANAYHLSGNKQKSKQMYLHIVTVNPQDVKSWYNYAEACFDLQEYEQALTGYRKAYALKNRLPFIQVRMAHCMEQAGKPYKAKQMLRTFLREEHPGDPNTIQNLKTKSRIILAQMEKKYPGRRPA